MKETKRETERERERERGQSKYVLVYLKKEKGGESTWTSGYCAEVFESRREIL